MGSEMCIRDRPVFRIKRAGSRGAENSASSVDNVRGVDVIEQDDIAFRSEQSLPTSDNADDVIAGCDCRFGRGPDCRIQARTVPAAGQYTDPFFSLHHVVPPCQIQCLVWEYNTARLANQYDGMAVCHIASCGA